MHGTNTDDRQRGEGPVQGKVKEKAAPGVVGRTLVTYVGVSMEEPGILCPYVLARPLPKTSRAVSHLPTPPPNISNQLLILGGLLILGVAYIWVSAKHRPKGC